MAPGKDPGPVGGPGDHAISSPPQERPGDFTPEAGEDGAELTPELVHYSRGRDTYDAWPEQRSAPSFEAFAEAVLSDRSKAKGLTWLSAPFKPNSDGRHHRCREGALRRRFIAIDHDGGSNQGYVELGVHLSAYSGFAYTTASHTTKNPHSRHVLELSRPVDRAEGVRLGQVLQAQIEVRVGSRAVRLDPFVFRAEQPNFGPKLGAETMRYSGDPIDVDEFLKDAPPLKESPGRAERAEAIASRDPIVRALADRQMIKRDHGDGKLSIVCPCKGEHTGPSGETSTVYYLPNFGGVVYGKFVCMHEHCAKREQKDFIRALDLDPRDVWREQRGGAAPSDDLPPVEAYAGDAAQEGARASTAGAKAPGGGEASSGNGATPEELYVAEAVYRRLSDIQPKPIRWLWRGRIARGKVFMLAGHPGLGKSQALISVAAIVTTGGTWPLDRTQCEMGSVIVLSAEDDAEDTIRPRLEAAGADLDRVFILDAIREPNRDGGLITRPFNLTADIERLSDLARKIGDVGLIDIDPITAYLGGVDSHKNAEVRGVLAPLAAMAAETEAAIVCVSHLNKAGGPEAMLRVMGSLGFVAAARAAYLVAKDPEDETRRLFVPMKNNLAEDRGGLAFWVKGKTLESGIETSCVEWGADPVTMTADEAMVPAGDPEERSDLEDAKGFLRELLTDGPVPSKQVRSDGDGAGYSWATFRRAQKALGIGAAREGGLGSKGAWVWRLPTKALKNSLDAHTNIVSALGGNERLRQPYGNTCPSCDGEGCGWCGGLGRLVDDQPGEPAA